MKTLLTTLHSKYVHASLALPYLAAYCGQECGDIVIEEYTTHEPKEVVLGQIIAVGADVVCFSVYLWNRLATLELVACLKEINSQLKIVLGGPEISFEENDFFDRYPVDALICGEGEKPLRSLLSAWSQEEEPSVRGGIKLPGRETPHCWDLLDSLDAIPSPFVAELVDLSRGLVYYESSRGCPYSCSFCMSALDDRVRSFSMQRIKEDLLLLMKAEVPLIKFVDRTFNYDSARTRGIFSFILKHNRSSQFHFEIGGHLLDEETLTLLERVPAGVFQFEIGVQSTFPDTLKNVGRVASFERLKTNVLRLVEQSDIHIHLDLIAGLPGEGYRDILTSLDKVVSLEADHLQIELVKLLPGAPLRLQADQWGLRFDPNPPYTILDSDFLTYAELERLRGIGRLFDLLVNSGRFKFLLDRLVGSFDGLSYCLEDLDRYWTSRKLYRQSRSLRDLYGVLHDYLSARYSGDELSCFTECLARDYAHNERVVSGRAPAFFDTNLTEDETSAIRLRVKEELKGLERRGKVQYFAAVFHHQPEVSGRTVLIFLYIAKTASGLQMKELTL